MMGTEGNNTGAAPAANTGAAEAKAFEPPQLHLSVAPHIRSSRTVSVVMLAVIGAMLPAFVSSVVFFGMKALMLALVCIGTAIATECAANLIFKKKQSIGDFSAVITGMLLAFNLSPTIPLWMAAIGSAFAIAVAKMVFGGLGCNFINPALAGRAFLMASYPAEMTHFPATIYGSVNGLAGKAAEASPAFGAAAPAASGAAQSAADALASAAPPEPSTFSIHSALADTADAVSSATAAAASAAADTVSAAASSAMDAVSSATPLHAIKYAFATGAYSAEYFSHALKDLFFGNVAGCVGETSALALLAGGIFLMAIRVIDYRIPATYILTVFALFWIANGTGTYFTVDALIAPTFHILAGGLFLGAFFMATDPVTSPITPRGRVAFGVGCGALVFIIRKYG
ncbi:MAG: RnfABCDGE type electron transport complex subunit D, partial [Chitinispirillales bacterium]|nr:RnfABCDGE type electron transport complex subunit D [Chitinispirillales bacterium]